MNIPQDVLGVLALAQITDACSLVLPGQLDRQLYQQVAKVIDCMGGKWSRKHACHRFGAGDAIERVEQALATGQAINARQELGEFFSPPAVVERVMEIAAIKPGERVLEPSAGRGNLAVPAARHVQDPAKVECFEVNPTHASWMRQHFPGMPVHCMDFLSTDPWNRQFGPYDVVVMNPPFARGAAVNHVVHASEFLGVGGRLVAVMPQGVLWRQDRKHLAFRHLLGHVWQSASEHLPEDAFKSEGTSVRTCIVSFRVG